MAGAVWQCGRVAVDLLGLPVGRVSVEVEPTAAFLPDQLHVALEGDVLGPGLRGREREKMKDIEDGTWETW